MNLIRQVIWDSPALLLTESAIMSRFQHQAHDWRLEAYPGAEHFDQHFELQQMSDFTSASSWTASCSVYSVGINQILLGASWELDSSCWAQVWAMLHSGSRGIGNQTAQHHDRVAQKRGFAEKDGLNYMRIDSQEGQDYLKVNRTSL